MMKKYLVVFCALVFVFSMAGFANALSNAGFETGDLTDWTVTIPVGGTASVVTSHTDDDGTVYGPVEGSYFAELKTGDELFESTILDQLFTISAGAYIEGWAAYDAWVGAPDNPNAWVLILDQSGTTVLDIPWGVSRGMVGDYGESPWEYWSWTAKDSGTYTLRLAARADPQYQNGYAYGLFDVHGVVPEPGTLFLFSAGLIALFALGRKTLVKK